jgi:hypothetical protein
MSDIKLPYITWRGGRPRFNPSSREQALGFRGEDLRHADGRWYTLDDAKAFAEQKLAEIKAARIGGKRRAIPATRGGATVGDLLDDWLDALNNDSDPDTRLSPDTIESYEKAARAIRWKPESRRAAKIRREHERAAKLLGVAATQARHAEPFALAPVAAIDKIALKEFFLYLKKARGHHMAQSAVAAFSAAFTWGGLDRRWRLGANPRHSVELPRPEGRIVIYSEAELAVLNAAATHLNRASIGDAIFLGLFTAQRQRDRIFLADEGLIDGRRHFRQSKTKRLVAIRETPQLAMRLEQARARVAAIKLRMGTRPDTIVVDEMTGMAYSQDTFRHVFAKVRALAARSMPSLAGKRDQDLRDTAVTWLARSGCTLLEICAISGHSPRSVQTIIKHYLGSYAELGDSGIDKLVAWIAREGIAV